MNITKGTHISHVRNGHGIVTEIGERWGQPCAVVIFQDGFKPEPFQFDTLTKRPYEVLGDLIPATDEEIAELEQRVADRIARLAIEKASEDDARARGLEATRTNPDYAHLTVCEHSGGVEAAKNLRKDLKKHFPGVKFSVRSDYSSINVKWVDGPTRAMVEAIANRYQSGSFNGMEDIYEFSHSPFTTLFGGAQYVFCYRDLSDELEAATFERLRRRYPEAPTLEDYKRGNLWQFEAYRYTVQEALANAGHEELEEEQDEPAEQVTEVVQAATPAPVKPRFTAQQVSGVWSVTIEQGETRHQFDGIEATTLAEACRLAWALLTLPTPPDDDPSGQPLPTVQIDHIHDLLETGRKGEPGEVFQQCLRHDKAPTSKIPAMGIASVKKDGMFVAALHCKGRPWFFARSGQLMKNTDLLQIPPAALDALQAKPDLIHQFEFKADALRQSVFNGAVSPARVNPVDPEVAALLPAFTPWLINVIPVADFIGTGDGKPLAERKAMTKAISERHGLPMPEHRTLSWGDAMTWFAELVEQNEEGIVYDNPVAAYVPGARRADLSIKRAKELRLDLRCVGVAEGKGKHAGVVGKLLFEYEGSQIPADLGEGWAYADRVRLMLNPAEAVGQVFEVYAFDVSELGSLRQAKVGQPRPDKLIAD